MQIIYTATTGRSGTTSLAHIVNEYGKRCVAEHEPPDLVLRQIGHRAFFRRRGWLGNTSRVAMIGRAFQRRFLVTNEMMGRGKALKWYDSGDEQNLLRLARKRHRRATRFSRFGVDHYLESSQFFIRTFCDQAIRVNPNLGLIKLTRDPLENARSLANRKRSLFDHALPPDRKSNIFRVEDWQSLSPFQIFLVQWVEQQLRFHRFVETHEVQRLFSIRTEELGSAERIKAMFDFFGIEHLPIGHLPTSNTNTRSGYAETKIGKSDTDEFYAVLDLLPSAMLDRIDALKGYKPERAADAHADTAT